MTADTVVVVNPASAGGRTGRDWPVIAAALRDAGVAFEERFTSAAREATAITRGALAEGCRRVVGVGGDGTLNEIVNGALDDSGQPLVEGAAVGLLPNGTGGDFRRTAHIPLDHAAAAALLARGDVRRIDAGRIEYGDGSHHHFVNIADCGLGGEVVTRVNASTKAAGGSATFRWHSMRALLAWGRRRARVEIDGVPMEAAIQNVVMANGRCFGAGMVVAPHAELDDGLLDVVVSTTGRLRSLLEMRRIYAGTHLGTRGIAWTRAREVRVIPLDDVRFGFDVEGEQIGAAPATVRVLPGVVTICAPARVG